LFHNFFGKKKSDKKGAKGSAEIPNIRVISNDGRVYKVPLLKNSIGIGRSKDNDIVLPDQTVSRNHARITETEEGHLLTDLGSFNGTTVNEESIQTALLKHNDRIKLGLVKLIFLTKEETTPSSAESLIQITEDSDEKKHHQILESRPEGKDPHETQALLITLESKSTRNEAELPLPLENEGQKTQISKELSSLERSNKVLFVLYEISRQLHSIHDFHELLNKIMGLIFMVIDADFGFVILTGDKAKDELIPVVVKTKDGTPGTEGKINASRTIINKVIHDKVALLASDALDDSRLDQAKSVVIQKIRSAICVPLWKKDEIIGVIQLDSIRFDNPFNQDDLELLKAIGSQMSMIIEQASLNEQIREEERMRSRLERFHSPQIIETILEGGQETKDYFMEPKDVTATIVFTDINEFTRLSEHLPPRETNMILNQYFSRMTDIVFKYDGTLDKYMGDGLMAVFGAPMARKDDPIRAIQAAREMREELAAMMENEVEDRKFSIRIGINTGRVVAGNIGSPKRLDYTVIGDPVNIASRLESMAEHNQILIGEETFRFVKEKFEIKEVGPKKFRGKSEEITVYEVK
jgi:adenylate cyclase